MRCYISVVPKEIQDFLNTGKLKVDNGFVISPELAIENQDLDEEELEFAVSYRAAQNSKERQGGIEYRGFAMALEVPAGTIGEINSQVVPLDIPMEWGYVEALLISESDEDELSWFAPQEISHHLNEWLS